MRGKIYFTRRNKKSSWYKNLLNNDKAEFELDGKIFYGTAKEMNDKNLISHISQIKYTNEKRMSLDMVLKLKLKER